MELTKERKYNKIADLSRIKGGLTNAGTTIYLPEYKNMTWQQRVQKSALQSSDNGRCWWIYDHIIRTTLLRNT